MAFEKQAVLIYAGTNGYFDAVQPEQVAEKAKSLVDYLEKMHSGSVIEKIRTSGEIAEDTEKNLRKALDEFNSL